MPRPRASILGLIAAVVASAVAFAALRTGSEYWLSAFYTLTVVMLLFAVIAARYRRGPARAFWFGFAVFGWGFFLLGSNAWMTHLGGIIEQGSGGGQLNRNLLTTRVIQAVVTRIRKPTNNVLAINLITAQTIGIVQLGLTLILASLGGLLAAWMKGRNRGPRPTSGGRSANLPASLVILTGLGASALAYFDRPPPSYFADSDAEALEPGGAGFYSRSLDMMGERPLPPLARSDPEAAAVRLLWIPTFDHPISVRVARTPEGAMVRAVVLAGAGGYEPGGIAIDRTFPIGPDAWNRVEKHLAESGFWAMPATVPIAGTIEDGDHTLIEGVGGGRYHAARALGCRRAPRGPRRDADQADRPRAARLGRVSPRPGRRRGRAPPGDPARRRRGWLPLSPAKPSARPPRSNGAPPNLP